MTRGNIILLFLPYLQVRTIDSIPAPLRCIGIQQLTPETFTSGSYEVYWDDKVNGQMDNMEKSCTVSIKVLDGDVVGSFGLIAGQDRKASLVGRVEAGEQHLGVLNFRQREPGYTCSYQIGLGTGSFIGAWHDTKRRSGDFMLLRTQ